jgi:hypothetical protein
METQVRCMQVAREKGTAEPVRVDVEGATRYRETGSGPNGRTDRLTDERHTARGNRESAIMVQMGGKRILEGPQGCKRRFAGESGSVYGGSGNDAFIALRRRDLSGCALLADESRGGRHDSVLLVVL